MFFYWRFCDNFKICVFNLGVYYRFSDIGPLPLVVEVKWVSEVSEWSEVKWSNFWVFKISGTFICYRGCLNLNWYISKKVQKNFLMGLKIWWSWGSRIFFSKSPIVGRFSIFHAKLQVFLIRLKRIPIVFDSKEFQIFWIKKNSKFFGSD